MHGDPLTLGCRYYFRATNRIEVGVTNPGGTGTGFFIIFTTPG
ncbi:MAG: hypothetical protein WC364_08375 [Eubacteriales bacterium]